MEQEFAIQFPEFRFFWNSAKRKFGSFPPILAGKPKGQETSVLPSKNVINFQFRKKSVFAQCVPLCIIRACCHEGTPKQSKTGGKGEHQIGAQCCVSCLPTGRPLSGGLKGSSLLATSFVCPIFGPTRVEIAGLPPPPPPPYAGLRTTPKLAPMESRAGLPSGRGPAFPLRAPATGRHLFRRARPFCYYFPTI